MTMFLSRLKYLVAACALALGISTTKASTVYVTDLSVTGVRSCGTTVCEWLSQPFTFQPGDTVNFGTAILYPMQPACGIFCAWAGVPWDYRAWYGSPPTSIQLANLLFDMTGGGAVDQCAPPGFPGCPPSRPPSPPIPLIFTLPSDQDTVSLVFLSYAEPTLTPPTVPLPAAFPLFATGLGALGLLGWRRKKKAAAV
jgi:hypothetical protein